MQQSSGLPNNRVGIALRYLMGGMLLMAIAIMLAGVFLRYVAGPLSDRFDLDRIDFFWVEESGEMLLGWLTFIGAGLGILERSHFAITFAIESLSPATRRTIHRFNMALAAGFGVMLAWHGWQLAELNAMLTTPALQISMGWLYAALVTGGALIAICAVIAVLRPEDPAADRNVAV
jgi:TRAP-type C4-dicarboxylate transport system permease small subunit